MEKINTDWKWKTCKKLGYIFQDAKPWRSFFNIRSQLTDFFS